MPKIPEVGKAAVVLIASHNLTAEHCVHCAAALMSLKRKKAYEKQIEQIDNSISRVNEQQMMLENQRTTAETVLALQQGVRANKATMQVIFLLCTCLPATAETAVACHCWICSCVPTALLDGTTVGLSYWCL